MTYLIALTVNLAGTLLIYSLLAFALVRLNWHRRGMFAVLVTLFAAGLFWIAPALLVFGSASVATSVSYSIWFGNWLVSGFGIILLCQTIRWIPRQFADSAQLDGCGQFGTYWHVLLPLVRRELGLLAFLTAMATSLPFWFLLSPDNGGGFSPLWLALLRVTNNIAGSSRGALIGGMMAGSIVATLPVILIFLFAKRYLQQTPDSEGTGSVPSTR